MLVVRALAPQQGSGSIDSHLDTSVFKLDDVRLERTLKFCDVMSTRHSAWTATV